MQVLQQQQAHVPNTPLYPTPAAPVQQAADIDITELESLLCKIMESCTKDSISVSCSLLTCSQIFQCFQILVTCIFVKVVQVPNAFRKNLNRPFHSYVLRCLAFE